MIFVDKAGLNDLELILELEESGFDPREQWSEPGWRAELLGHDRIVLVSRAGDGGLLGAITVQVVGDTADLLRVVVASGARRQGVAQALIRAAVDRSRAAGAGRMLLEVAEDNAAARALYARAGFAELSRRRGYYRDVRDAVVMSLEWEER